MKDTRFAKLVLFVNALVPLALLLWDVYHKRVGANPLEFATRTTGMLTLLFLVSTLAVTPVRQITRLNWLIKFRRMLGLFAFFYGFLHLLTYVWFDRYFNFKSIPADVATRPFIAVGVLAFFLMAPLAVTSTDKMIKRLGGKTWRKLHKLVYAGGVAGVIHFWLLVKSDTRLPLTFGFVLLLLLAHRLFVKYYPPDSERPASLLPSK
ncbi:MAG TPA: protein-methionine-sulfoxide reductase heme-binding subunit MsrQ [Pyrinomonadaceae bacterium]|jgi:sulfoxide reductase heme-binding subunit YedZ|nr:protein-methionine-sulfoxide reductase heme-binding subunit MsrQ [Pyrinomonadaceae bacterium]